MFNNKVINSVQVVVPYKKCVNNCKFCISRMNRITEDNQGIEFSKNMENIYKKKLKFLHDHGCTNIVITGDNEPLMNIDFLTFFSNIINTLDFRFNNIEIQTSGVFLNRNLLEILKNKTNVNLVSISVASLDLYENANVYEYKNISIMFDKDCMKNEIENGYRYVVLLPNGELLRKWGKEYYDE